MSLKGLEQLFENLDGLWSWEVEEGLCHFCVGGIREQKLWDWRMKEEDEKGVKRDG